MRTRKDIAGLRIGGAELNNLLKAFIALKNAGGFVDVAGLHGLPNPSNCPHNKPEFLPWHRLYVLDLENRLNQFSAESISLPYWNWTSEDSLRNGIPEIFIRPTVMVDGVEVDNPLHSTFVSLLGRDTRRNVGHISRLTTIERQVVRAMRQSNFDLFTNDIESPHGGIHVWVAGDMGSVAYAAYDPIFWFHHCNVDKQWYDWQLSNGNGSMSNEILNTVLSVYGNRISETLSVEQLGYVYVDSPEEEMAMAETAKSSMGEPKKEVMLDGMKMTKDTIEVNVFAADNGSGLSKDERLLGSVVMLGMDGAMNPNGFKGTFKRGIDIPSTFNIENADQLDVVATDRDGNELPLSQIPLSSVTVQDIV